jgi:hypothetical protein
LAVGGYAGCARSRARKANFLWEAQGAAGFPAALFHFQITDDT